MLTQKRAEFQLSYQLISQIVILMTFVLNGLSSSTLFAEEPPKELVFPGPKSKSSPTPTPIVDDHLPKPDFTEAVVSGPIKFDDTPDVKVSSTPKPNASQMPNPQATLNSNLAQPLESSPKETRKTRKRKPVKPKKEKIIQKKLNSTTSNSQPIPLKAKILDSNSQRNVSSSSKPMISDMPSRISEPAPTISKRPRIADLPRPQTTYRPYQKGSVLPSSYDNRISQREKLKATEPVKPRKIVFPANCSEGFIKDTLWGECYQDHCRAPLIRVPSTGGCSREIPRVPKRCAPGLARNYFGYCVSPEKLPPPPRGYDPAKALSSLPSCAYGSHRNSFGDCVPNPASAEGSGDKSGQSGHTDQSGGAGGLPGAPGGSK